MFCAEPGSAAIYEPGSYLFRRITKLEDNLSYSRAADLAALLRALDGPGPLHCDRFFHSPIQIMSAQSAYVETGQ